MQPRMRVSMLAFLRLRRYFLRMEVASGLLCQSSSMRGTKRGQALAVSWAVGAIFWSSVL